MTPETDLYRREGCEGLGLHPCMTVVALQFQLRYVKPVIRCLNRCTPARMARRAINTITTRTIFPFNFL
ncbi:MAG: hypothetical protein HYW02_06020 [Deltaproteobacteria bacterium]|nr:hypothetical protein [Deltaproteobacteria bacterium]